MSPPGQIMAGRMGNRFIFSVLWCSGARGCEMGDDCPVGEYRPLYVRPIDETAGLVLAGVRLAALGADGKNVAG